MWLDFLCGGGTAATASYSIGGTVTSLTGTVVLQDNGGDDLAIAANGSFTFPVPVAYGSTYSVTVLTQPSSQACSVTSGNGTMGATNGSLKYTGKAATGSNPQSVTVDPSGKYAYVANNGSNDVSQYTIAADGSLSAMVTATVAAGSNPQSVTVDPSGKYAYVTNGNSGTVSQYTIAANGSLSAMVTPTVAAGTGPQSVTTTGTWQ